MKGRPQPASQGVAAHEQIISTSGTWVLAVPSGTRACGFGLLGAA